MKIAHEAPMCIMEEVQNITDYDYCLVHLLEESREYLDFFMEAKVKGRKIIMDCSLFELGEAFNFEKYYKWLQKIQPDEYIIPDVWQNCEENFISYEKFTESFDLSSLIGKKIGVLQGKSVEDFEKAYQFMDERADKIAISFGYDFYLSDWRENIESKAQAFSRNRINLIKHLLSKDLINKNKPHHLLGCGIPTEFSFYRNEKCSFIESLDTSHPVLSGFFKKSYINTENLISKIPQKMIDVFEETVTEDQLETIKDNINIFKTLCTHN
jgi:hypothetical protein